MNRKKNGWIRVCARNATSSLPVTCTSRPSTARKARPAPHGGVASAPDDSGSRTVPTARRPPRAPLSAPEPAAPAGTPSEERPPASAGPPDEPEGPDGTVGALIADPFRSGG